MGYVLLFGLLYTTGKPRNVCILSQKVAEQPGPGQFQLGRLMGIHVRTLIYTSHGLLLYKSWVCGLYGGTDLLTTHLKLSWICRHQQGRRQHPANTLYHLLEELLVTWLRHEGKAARTVRWR